MEECNCNIFEAAENYDHFECLIRHVLERGEDVNKQHPTNTPLHGAAKEGNVEAIKFLISNGANVNVQLETSKLSPLHRAVLNGRVEVVKILVENGADVNIKDKCGNTPIFFTKFLKDDYDELEICEEILKILINNGTNIEATNDSGYTAFQYSICSCDDSYGLEHLKLLVKYGATANITASPGFEINNPKMDLILKEIEEFQSLDIKEPDMDY